MPQQLNKPNLSAAQQHHTRPLPCHAVKAARAHHSRAWASLLPSNHQQLSGGGVQRTFDHVNPARILQQMMKQQDAIDSSSSAAQATPAPAAPPVPEAAPNVHTEQLQPEHGGSSSSSMHGMISLPQQLAAVVAHASSAMPWFTVGEVPADAAVAATSAIDDTGDCAVMRERVPGAAVFAGGETSSRSNSSVGIDAGPFLVVTSQPQEMLTLQQWGHIGPAADVQGSAGTSSSSSSSSSGGDCTQESASSPGRPASCAAGTVQHYNSDTVAAVRPYSAPARKASSTAAATPPLPDNQLCFAKHLAAVSNGCAAPSSRFESLGWLLFQSKQQQAALGLDKTTNPNEAPKPQALAQAWLANLASRQLLEQVYLIGQAAADLGTADGLQPLSCSNGSRAIVSLDYAKLLERYLQQHGQLLVPDVWVHWPDDELQAKAIHVSTCLETRCMVHSMLFEKLIERVGLEAVPGSWATGSRATLAAAAGGEGGGNGQHLTGPLATAISNTIINTSRLVNSPTSSQTVVAAPSASATGNTADVSNASHNVSNSSSSSTPAAQGGADLRSWLNLGSLGAVLIVVWHAAGEILKVVVAVAMFAKDLAVQLMLLRAVRAAAQGLAASSTVNMQLAGNAVSQKTQQACHGGGGTADSSFEHATKGAHKAAAAAAAQRAQQCGQQLPAHSATPMPGWKDTGAVLQQTTAPPAAAAAAKPAGSRSNRFKFSATGMLPVGSLGLLSAEPVVARQAAKQMVCPQQQQQQRHFQQQENSTPLQTAASDSRGMSVSRQPRKAVGVQFDPQLLYQLWTPEVARCA